MISPMIKHFDETHKELDKNDLEDYIDDLLFDLDTIFKHEVGLIDDEELEDKVNESEQRMCRRYN